jgi:hypothetical protein
MRPDPRLNNSHSAKYRRISSLWAATEGSVRGTQVIRKEMGKAYSLRQRFDARSSVSLAIGQTRIFDISLMRLREIQK